MASKKEIRQSETRVVKRSEINLNRLNPKRHSDENIALQVRNLKNVGYLGGIVMNETTHNLLDGHRRIFALDRIHKYDGTPETDYEVKIEVTALDENEEKRQMTYMAIGNTKADLDLIANYSADIDLSGLGFTEAEMKALEAFNAKEEDIFKPTPRGFAPTEGDVANAVNGNNYSQPVRPESSVEEFFDFLPSATQQVKGTENLTPEEKKAIVMEGNAKNKENILKHSEVGLTNLVLEFPDMDSKVYFCEFFGFDAEKDTADGTVIIDKFEE